MDDQNTQRPSGRSAGRVSGLKMFLETMSFFLPLACFPLADLLFCDFWAGRSSNDLPFPPVVLSLITGGVSMLITCAMVALRFTNAAYLYFSCANFSYITLFLFENVASLADSPSMPNVSHQIWGVNPYYFSILFTLFQVLLTSALRRSGGSDEDLGLFGHRIADYIWNHIPNSNGSSGVGLTLAGNQAVIEQSIVSPPAYEDCNDNRYTLLITDERFYSRVSD